jgi:uncharacterized protein YndB with AHSA1/START domain
MRVLKLVLTAVAILILVFVVVGMVLSRDYKVSRTVTIQADPAKVHELVGDLKRWDEWAPWKKADPTLVTTFGPTTTGVGASQSWSSANDDGGRLTLTKCDPATGIAYDMAFRQGDEEIPAKSWMSYTPAPGGVQVEWGIEGEMDMAVIGGYFAAMADAMIGPMFQQGLADLKARAEAR